MVVQYQFLTGAHALRCDGVRWDATTAKVVDEVWKGGREEAGERRRVAATPEEWMQVYVRMRNAVACDEINGGVRPV